MLFNVSFIWFMKLQIKRFIFNIDYYWAEYFKIRVPTKHAFGRTDTKWAKWLIHYSKWLFYNFVYYCIKYKLKSNNI